MKKVIAILVLATAGSFAHAQTASSKPVGPWYVGLSGGRSAADLDDRDYFRSWGSIVTLNADTRDTAWRVFVGYNFNENWGVEGSYTDLGRIKASYAWSADGTPLWEVTGDQVAWSALVKGALPINKQFDVFALLGLSSNRTKVTVTEINLTFTGVPSGSDHRTRVMSGIGVEYKPNPNVGIRLEYQNYDQFGGSSEVWNDPLRMTVDAWMLGASVRF